MRASGLALGYADRTVLSGVDLAVRAGEVWFLLGPNGTGKTTLLRAVLGLLEPRGGALELDPRRASRERIGFVPQHCDLARSLPTTLREFVSLGLVGTGVPRAERAERLGWALERMGLCELESTDYWALSGGQRQRALVARALIRRPSLMVFDEPTEGLDVPSEEALLATLEELNATEGTTLLFVTHKLSLAERYATHVALFHCNTVRAGPRAEVLHPEAIADAFGVTAGHVPGAGPSAVAGAARG